MVQKEKRSPERREFRFNWSRYDFQNHTFSPDLSQFEVASSQGCILDNRRVVWDAQEITLKVIVHGHLNGLCIIIYRSRIRNDTMLSKQWLIQMQRRVHQLGPSTTVHATMPLSC